MSNFWNALTFLTVIPVPKQSQAPPTRSAGDMMIFFPLVGALLGLLLAAVALVLMKVLPAPVVGLLVTLLWALLTGGLHLDGVADTCDGVFSSRTRERALEIMKDSRIGTMGAIGLFGVLYGKSIALPLLGDVVRPLIAAALLGRWAMVLAATTSRYARAEGGMGSDFIRSSPGRLAVASLWLAPIFYLLSPDLSSLLVALGVVVAFTLFAREIFNRKLGGLTGDCLGAVCEISELLVLAVYAGIG